MKLYQNEESLKSDNLIKQREFELIKELEFVNSRNMSLTESLNIFQNGIPLNDIEKRILELEAELSKLKSQLNPTMLFEFTEKYLNEKRQRKEMIRLHEAVLNRFKLFIHPREDIAINDLTYELLNDFQVHLTNEISLNSSKSYIKKFNNIFREAQKRENLNIKLKNPFSDLKKINTVEKDDKTISLESLKKVLNLDIFNEIKILPQIKQRAVDLFLFQFAIGGHDLVDLANLKWSNIKDDRIIFKRHKNRSHNNGGVLVNNKLFPIALNVIEKYGTKENERVFSFIPLPDYETKNHEYLCFNISYNNNLKSIQNHLQLTDKLLSKRARYTFNTIAGNLLINRDIIEEIQGHTQSSISHGYYGGTFNDIKDAEHLKVIEAVFGE
ncbi:site-specific integrase [Empedobacter stercoris]|uniref:phage integrase SAM-like domain-containing protein n=1 Tax=Empedobacter stercoris TaxID=1628248 RepID=UPI001CE09DE3|nr:phage integrase SAM-like domain-containing protein [Empedobacter stercoris]MCA4782860.1 site-specific integrase [Empedobacter stercoris]